MPFLRASPSCINHLLKAHILISTPWGISIQHMHYGMLQIFSSQPSLTWALFLACQLYPAPSAEEDTSQDFCGVFPSLLWLSKGHVGVRDEVPKAQKEHVPNTGGLLSSLSDPRLFVTMLGGHVPRWSP